MITQAMVDEFNAARAGLESAQKRLIAAEEAISVHLQEGEMRSLGARVPAISKVDGHIIYGSIAPLIDETNEHQSGIRSEQPQSVVARTATFPARDPSTYTRI